MEDVAEHNNQKDLWLIIDGQVYDVTDWQKLHPGGAAALLQFAGGDASEAAGAAHAGKRLPGERMQELRIGSLRPGAPAATAPATPPEGSDQDTPRGTLSRAKASASEGGRRRLVASNALLSPNALAEELQEEAASPAPASRIAGSNGTGGASASNSRPTSLAHGPIAGGVKARVVDPVPEVPARTDEQEFCDADIKVDTFEELALDPEVVKQVQSAWEHLCRGAKSREAVGENIYTALFESAPSLQALFTTPRAVQALKFVNGVQALVNVLDNPAQLKTQVETLAFGHLNLDVTVPRAMIFRDAILEMFDIELAEHFNEEAKQGWQALLNYVSGSFTFVRSHYAVRLKILEESWKKANANEKMEVEHVKAPVEDHSKGTIEERSTSRGSDEKTSTVVSPRTPGGLSQRLGRLRRKGGKDESAEQKSGSSPRESPRVGAGMGQPQKMVRTYKGMFEFNAAVMGFSSSAWLREVTASFDAIVTNMSNNARLQEECDIICLKISRIAKGEVNLAEYKSIMLATLRSLLPKAWDSSYEVAWNWLWDNVDRLLRRTLGRPRFWELALAHFWESMEDAKSYEMRKAIYQRFFQLAPEGQEYFKQSDTRLHFIAERISQMTLELFRRPHEMVDDISALGLRHVGYGIPTELFGPYVSASVEVLRSMTDDHDTCDAYRWALGLISQMLVRTISEGSTVVMQAINSNSVAQLRRAVSCAPRGLRAQWVLKVEVGSQSISPLMWAIESGRLDAAKAIIEDLLTIRADRERYYYGVEDLFNRHNDIIRRLCTDAPELLPTLLDGLVWRSRLVVNDQRRANYYVKHLLLNLEGGISDTLKWLVAAKDPKSMAHPVIILVSDTLWTGIVYKRFILSKLWFMASLVVLMLGQAILPKTDGYNFDNHLGSRIAVFIFRLTMYVTTMVRLFHKHSKLWLAAYQERNTLRCCGVPVPKYLKDKSDLGELVLLVTIILMCSHEPMFWCAGGHLTSIVEAEINNVTQNVTEADAVEFPTDTCDASDDVQYRYSVFGMGAMMMHWLLLIDLSVFSTGLSSFVLIIGQVINEMTRFLTALVFLLLTFSSAISVLLHSYPEMQNIPDTATTLFAVILKISQDDYRPMGVDPFLLTAIFMFILATGVVLLNLLIAQITNTYMFINQDMIGFARMNRAGVIVETLGMCDEAVWASFVESLKLDQPLEFNQGDVGLSGGIQILEPATMHATSEDTIIRVGGSCALDIPWPEEAVAGEDDNTKYDRLEKQLSKVLRRVVRMGKKKRKDASSSGHFSSSGVNGISSAQENSLDSE